MNGIFLTAFENSLFISAAALLLLLFTLFFRNKTPAMLRRACWIILALWFLIPVRPTLYTVTLPQETINPALASFYSQLLDYRAMLDVIEINENNESINIPTQTSELSSGSIETEIFTINESNSNLEPSTVKNWNFSNLAISIWVLGMLTALTVYTLAYRRFIHRIKRPGITVTDSVLNDLLDDVRREIKLKRSIELAICPIISTPVVTGFFRPVIYLPNEQVNYRELRFILMHEATHIKNGDMWVKLLSLSVMIVHWFNPVVYLMNRAMFMESELACDNTVLRYTGDEQRMQYGQTVFQAATHNRQPRSMLSSAFSDSGKTLKRRLFAIIKQNQTRRWIMVCCTVVLILTLPAFIIVGFNRSEAADVPESLSDLPLSNEIQPENHREADDISEAEPNENIWASKPIVIDPKTVDTSHAGDFVAYLPQFSAGLVSAFDAYKKMYPNVNVKIEILSDADEYESRVSTELAVGTGPDVIFLYNMINAKMHEMLDSGVFLDLNEFIENENDFNYDEYVEAVLDSGLHNGKRYIMPFAYIAPVFIASTNVLNEIGFDLSQTTDIVSFINEAVRCLPKAQENPLFKSMFNNNLWFALTRFVGIDLIDFKNNELFPDENGVRNLLEAFKPYHHIDSDFSLHDYENIGDNLRNGAVTFHLELAPHSFIERASTLKTDGDFEMLAIPGINGEVRASSWDTVAIRSDSPNRENAWNFVKLLLSPELQNNMTVTSAWVPVHKESIVNKIGSFHYYYNGEITYTTGETNIHTKLSDAEIQAYLDIITGVEHCFVYESREVRSILHNHITPYFNDETTYETAITGLRNQLLLFMNG